jgi:rSAM/selenodomain-associated transferase 1
MRLAKLPRILDAAQLWIKNIVYNLPVPLVQPLSRPLLVLFAKAPIPGGVKTRLAAEWGDAAAARLHSAFVLDTLEKLRQFSKFADLELHTDISTDAWGETGVARDLQAAGALELKLIHALGRGLDQGRSVVMILGSDSPTLPHQCIHGLLESKADVALGPCEDGGYYAISCRRVASQMFHGVEWSTSNVLEQTERASRSCGLTVERGQLWYDVDFPADVMRLAAEPRLPRHTRQILRELAITGPTERKH